MSLAQEEKQALRRRMSEQRSALSPEESRAKSQKAQELVIGLAPFRAAAAVGLYRPLGKETATEAIAMAAWSAGKQVAVPVLRNETVEFVSIGPSSRFVRSELGFEVPEAGHLIPLDELDLVVVPGLAFDPLGNRLGRGRGHYDRMLPHASRELVTIGLGYSFQVIAPWTPEPHDQPLHWVVSDAGAMKTGLQPSIPEV